MSLPRYPKYKDSGVEWLGNVPEHWLITKLKRVVNPERKITYGIVQAGPHVPDGIPYIRPADMTDEQGIASLDQVLRTSLEIADGYRRSTIRTGDLVCSIGPSFGKVMVTPNWLDGANLTQGTARIAVQPPYNARYMFWTLRSTTSLVQWESSVGGATFRALNLGPLAETVISSPPEAEQNAIALFLDRETAKIDALVEEQRRLIELLNEKRQAIVSHAVTKGLNPNAPLKDSGVDWLGKVPTHWRVERARHCFLERDERSTSGEEEMLTVSHLTGVTPRSEKTVYMFEAETNEGYKKCLAGDLVINTLWAWMGAMGIARQSGIVSPAYHVYTPRPGFASSYVDKLVRIGNFADETARWSKGVWSSRLRLYPQEFFQINLPVPPLDEQLSIAEAVDNQIKQSDLLINEAHQVIDLLQERRSALVSAAVTGKIDVRGLVKEDAA